MKPTLHIWNGVLWSIKNSRIAHAYCPKHQGLEMDVKDAYGKPTDQDTFNEYFSPTQFVCPIDDETYTLEGDYFTLRRRVIAITLSVAYKEATIIDLDNIYTPVLRVAPKPKDDRYSIQVEIDETPNGKKLVIYAADRQENGEKTQIFIDPQVDKLTFDSRNDLHPNMVFAKVVASFKDGRSVSLDANPKEDK